MLSKAVIGVVGLVASVGAGGVAAHAAAGHHTGAQAKGLYARADHITLEVRDKGQWVTYDMDRGKVTAVSSSSITLARPDGQSVTEAIDSNTKYKGVSSASAIQIGKRALVVSEDGTAVRIRQGSGAQGAGTVGGSATT